MEKLPVKCHREFRADFGQWPWAEAMLTHPFDTGRDCLGSDLMLILLRPQLPLKTKSNKCCQHVLRHFYFLFKHSSTDFPFKLYRHAFCFRWGTRLKSRVDQEKSPPRRHPLPHNVDSLEQTHFLCAQTQPNIPVFRGFANILYIFFPKPHHALQLNFLFSFFFPQYQGWNPSLCTCSPSTLQLSCTHPQPITSLWIGGRLCSLSTCTALLRIPCVSASYLTHREGTASLL